MQVEYNIKKSRDEFQKAIDTICRLSQNSENSNIVKETIEHISLGILYGTPPGHGVARRTGEWVEPVEFECMGGN